MKETFNNLDQVFNVSAEVVEDTIVKKSRKKKETIKLNDGISDIKKDYEYTRVNLYSLIEKGQEAINGILELAQETEQARAYEVAGQLIKSVSDTADKLMDLQKKVKDIEEIKNISGPTNVTNALFVGSTAELSKLLKSQKGKEITK
tara:strand:+ start:3019 stop:3459 length:441 start_codon:yes stop_codon:yes gene_type:complete